MKTSGSHGWRWLVLIVVAACGGTDQTGPLDPEAASDAPNDVADAGADAGSCPAPDGGRIQLTRRGCPVTLEIGIR